MSMKKNWISTMTATLLALSATGFAFTAPISAAAVTTSGMTSTRMPGYSEFEVGKGYVNAYAAIDKAQHLDRNYGAVVNQTFNAKYSGSVDSKSEQKAWSPATTSTFTFNVGDNAQITDFTVAWGEAANLLTVRVTAPDGTVTTTNANLLGAVYGTQTSVALTKPQKGTYQVEVLGACGTALGLPDTVNFSLRTYYGTFSGMNDIAGTAYETAVRTAVEKRLLDSADATNFQPNALITKGDLARWIASDFEIRQNLTQPLAYTVLDGRQRALGHQCHHVRHD